MLYGWAIRPMRNCPEKFLSEKFKVQGAKFDVGGMPIMNFSSFRVRPKPQAQLDAKFAVAPCAPMRN